MTDKMFPSGIRDWIQVRIDRGGFVPGLRVYCSGGGVFLHIPPGVPDGNRHERKVTDGWTRMRLTGARLAELAATLGDFDLKMLANFNGIKPASALVVGDGTKFWEVVEAAKVFDAEPDMIVIGARNVMQRISLVWRSAAVVAGGVLRAWGLVPCALCGTRRPR